jgi:hypothetical protein
MQSYLRHARDPTSTKGYQSLKSLTKHGASLANLEVTGEDIGSFKKVARKYNIDFALHKDTSESPPRWLVFFKAADVRAIESAFDEYAKAIIPRDRVPKPPLMEQLEKFKALAQSILAPVRNRNRGGHEL